MVCCQSFVVVCYLLFSVCRLSCVGACCSLIGAWRVVFVACLVVGCLLFVVFLFVACRLLCVGDCCLLVVVLVCARSSLLVVRCLLCVAC